MGKETAMHFSTFAFRVWRSSQKNFRKSSLFWAEIWNSFLQNKKQAWHRTTGIFSVPLKVPLSADVSIKIWKSHFLLDITLLLTYTLEQSPYWEANRFSASQEIPGILWNTKFHYLT
jgi:hypothetical protein